MEPLRIPLPTPCLACCDGVARRCTKNEWRVRKRAGHETRMLTTRVYTQAVNHVTAQLQQMQDGNASYVWIRKRFDEGWFDGYVMFQDPWFRAVYTDGDEEDLAYESALELATAWIKHACLQQ